jgi:hypothetical protein
VADTIYIVAGGWLRVCRITSNRIETVFGEAVAVRSATKAKNDPAAA